MGFGCALFKWQNCGLRAISNFQLWFILDVSNNVQHWAEQGWPFRAGFNFKCSQTRRCEPPNLCTRRNNSAWKCPFVASSTVIFPPLQFIAMHCMCWVSLIRWDKIFNALLLRWIYSKFWQDWLLHISLYWSMCTIWEKFICKTRKCLFCMKPICILALFTIEHLPQKQLFVKHENVFPVCNQY